MDMVMVMVAHATKENIAEMIVAREVADTMEAVITRNVFIVLLSQR